MQSTKKNISRVSVCIPTYNGEMFIKQQIDSILAQINHFDEISISDDGSTDNTIKILESYHDNRIKIYHDNTRKGYTGNLQNAIKHSNGDIIILADQDDVWLNNKVLLIKESLEKKSNDLFISDCFVVDEKLNIINNSYFSLRHFKKGFFRTLFKANYLGCCMAFNRKLLGKLIPTPMNDKMLPFDLWLGLIGYAFYKVDLSKEKLILYRRHKNNLSNGGINKKKNIFFMLRYRIYALYHIIKRFNKN